MSVYAEVLQRNVLAYGDEAFRARQYIDSARRLLAESEAQSERLRQQLAELEFRVEYAVNMRSALDQILAEADVADHLASRPEFAP